MSQRADQLPSKPEKSSEWRDSYYHKLFGLKAAEEVMRILPWFEKERSGDARPREAAEAIRDWSLGKRKLGMAEVRRLSLAAHAAAKEATSEAAKAAAHAAGQAIGTWHAPAHALGAFGYAGRVRGIAAHAQKRRQASSKR